MAAPLPVIPNVYYAHVQCLNGDLPTGNIFTWLSSFAGASPDQDAARAQSIASHMATRWVSQMLPMYPTTVTGATVRVYALGTPTNPAEIASASGVGANGDDVAPVSCCAVVKHNVRRRGRGSQSHSALSPLPVAAISVDGRSLLSGPQGTIQNNFGNFIGLVQAGFHDDFPTATIDYVQLSKKGTGTTYPILSSTTESLLGTERSRTPRP